MTLDNGRMGVGDDHSTYFFISRLHNMGVVFNLFVA